MSTPATSNRRRFARISMIAGSLVAAAAAGATGLATVAAAGTGSIPLTAGYAGSGGTLYGDPGWASRFWWAQTGNDCTLGSSSDVVGQISGSAPSERQIIARAEQLHLYNPATAGGGGGPITRDPQLMTRLLASYGIPSAFRTSQSMAALEADLGAGRAVIAGVDAPFIWNVTDPRSNPANDRDSYQVDHAVAVTGVDTATGIVYLNDTGDARVGREEQVPIAVFEKAWSAPFVTAQGRTIRNSLVVTAGRTEVAAQAAWAPHRPHLAAADTGAAPATSGTPAAGHPASAPKSAGLDALLLLAAGAAAAGLAALVVAASRLLRRRGAARRAASVAPQSWAPAAPAPPAPPAAVVPPLPPAIVSRAPQA